MTKEERENIVDKEVDQQIDLFLEYFNRHIPSSADLEYTSLRAHLFAEYYLNHLLILKLGSDKLNKIENLGFYAKVSELKELEIKNLKSWVVNALFKLNKIRNNLSHSLEYKVNEADVDSLGFYFGKEYIYRKFSGDRSDLKTNFRWVLVKIIIELYRPIIIEISMESLKRKNLLKSKTPPDRDASIRDDEKPLKSH